MQTASVVRRSRLYPANDLQQSLARARLPLFATYKLYPTCLGDNTPNGIEPM